jgi:hypothetical protein
MGVEGGRISPSTPILILTIKLHTKEETPKEEELKDFIVETLIYQGKVGN